MFITGASDLLPLPPVAGRNDANKNQASKQAAESSPPVRMDSGVTYFSPVVRIDPETQQTIIIFREGDGEVKRQYPSEEELEAYRNKEASEARTAPSAPFSQETDTEESSVPTVTRGGDAQDSQPVETAEAPPTRESAPEAPKPAAGNDTGGETPSGGSDIIA